jgi:nucleotide-binding universal stress UspA family protein
MSAPAAGPPGVAPGPPRERSATLFLLRPLLVASDGSDAALAALRVARALAAAGPPRAEHADDRETGVAVVAVTEPTVAGSATDAPLAAEQLSARMDRRLALVHAQLSALGERALAWPVEAPVGAPVAEIVRCAEACRAGLIVLGLGRHPAADRILGSEAARHVAERAAVPVLAVPPAATGRPRSGVCRVEAPDAGLTVPRVAAAILDPAGTLYLTRVVAFEDGNGERDGARGQRLEDVADALRADGATVPRIEIAELRGVPADALLGFARARGADLLAVGRPDDAPPGAVDALLAPLFHGAEGAVLVVPPPRPARHAG